MQAVTCALALLAGVVGAGFASGREIVRFFSSHGAAAAGAVCLAAGTLMFFFLRLSAKMDNAQATCVSALCRARFGRRFGSLCAGLFFLLSAVTGGAMLAACAELSALTLPMRGAYSAGLIVSLALSLLLSLKNARGLAVSGAALLALMPALLLRLLFLPAGEACFYPAMAPDLPVHAAADGVLYAALNAAMLLGTTPMLLALPPARRKKSLLLFGALFAALLFLGSAVCLRHIQIAASHPMPFLALSRRLRWGYPLIAACMYAASLSTLIAMLCSMRALLPLIPAASCAVSGIVCLLFARAGFSALVQSAYPALGAVCAGLLFLLCF